MTVIPTGGVLLRDEVPVVTSDPCFSAITFFFNPRKFYGDLSFLLDIPLKLPRYHVGIIVTIALGLNA